MHSLFIAHEADHRIAERHATAALARRRRTGAPVTRRTFRDIVPVIAGIVSRKAQPGADMCCTSASAAATHRATA